MARIVGLISSEEKTVLKPEEQKEWKALKAHLRAFHTAHALTPDVTGQFEAALIRLNNLKAIQVGEGAHLQEDLSQISIDSTLRAYIEMALLIAIGTVTLSLIGFSKNIFEKTISHRPMLNQ